MLRGTARQIHDGVTGVGAGRDVEENDLVRPLGVVADGDLR